LSEWGSLRIMSSIVKRSHQIFCELAMSR